MSSARHSITAPTDVFDEDVPELAGLTHGGQRLSVGPVVGAWSEHVEIRVAVQRSLGRSVALLHPAPGAPATARIGLRDEARLLARLDHPNIMPVHDVIEDDDGLAVILPRVPGRTWAERLAQPHVVRGTFGVTDLLDWHTRILLQVCRAIEHAHDNGIVHRDLRPAAVWVGDLGEVYVSRWSLACPMGEAKPMPDEVAATPGRASRLAPEMVLRSAGRVGPRTDVYQLGGLLYQVLTGHPPHDEEDPQEAVKRAIFQDPQLPADVTPSLASVCKRALARNPAARHPDVAAFRAHLEQGLAQRSAWAVAREADAETERLRRLLRTRGTTRDQVLRSFGAIRLGYERAADTAPDLAVARMRLDRAAEMVGRWQLDRGDLEGARSVVASMSEPPPGLVEELETRSTPLRGSGRARRETWRRPWLAAVLAMGWVPLPLVSTVVDDGPWSLPLMMGAAAGASLFAASVGRVGDVPRHGSLGATRLLAWATWTPLGLAILMGVAWGLGVQPDLGRYLVVVAMVLVVGTAAFAIDLALLGAMLAFGVACIATLAFPSTWVAAMIGANLVLAGILIGSENRGGDLG